MKITRIWAMPNRWTFTIRPAKELIERYVKENMIIVEPFTGKSKYGTITNDLNPELKAISNKDALIFLEELDDDIADIILFDPPYSFTQASQKYKEFGAGKLKDITRHPANRGYWAKVKNECSRILKLNGIAICFGWTSTGLSKQRGMDMEEILLIYHGGTINDTIVTVERKIIKQGKLL